MSIHISQNEEQQYDSQRPTDIINQNELESIEPSPLKKCKVNKFSLIEYNEEENQIKKEINIIPIPLQMNLEPNKKGSHIRINPKFSGNLSNKDVQQLRMLNLHILKIKIETSELIYKLDSQNKIV